MNKALRLYARTHRAGFYLAGMVCGCLLVVWSHGSSADVGSLTSDSGTPLIVVSLMMVGILTGLTWTSVAAEQDLLLTRRPSQVRRLHPWVVTGFSSACVIIAFRIANVQMESQAIAIRSILLWSALALVSGHVFGGVYPWVLPACYFLAVASAGYDRGIPYWWNVPMRPHDDIVSWGIVITIALCVFLTLPALSRPRFFSDRAS